MQNIYDAVKSITIAFLLGLVYSPNVFSQTTNSSKFCASINDEPAAKQFKSENMRLLANPCGTYYVNVFFHFIRDNSGNTGQPVTNVNQYMTILNNAFNGHNIFFANKGFDQINNSTLAATDYNHMSTSNFAALTQNWQSDAINIYIFRADKTAATSGGVAYRPGTKVAIGGGDFWVSNYALSNVLSHEVGHALNLYHTFEGTAPGSTSGCAENPNGSNGATCGDEVADTPADPNIAFTNAGNCTNPFTMVVGGITYNPDPRNMMSYATGNCLSLFSAGQATRMRAALEGLSVLAPVQAISLRITGPNPLCSSATGNFTLLGVPAGSTITWTLPSGITAISGLGTSNLQVQAAAGLSGTRTINVSITTNCSQTFTRSITIATGTPTAPTGMTAISSPAPNQICRNVTTTIAIGNSNHAAQSVTQYNWSFGAWGSNFTGYSSGGFVPTMRANLLLNSSSAASQTISATAQNACGTSPIYSTTFLAVNCGSFLVSYPNPAKDLVSLNFDLTTSKLLPDQIDLYHESSSKPVKQVNVDAINNDLKDDGQLTIPVNDLQRGTYYLHLKTTSTGQNERIRILLE